MKKNTRKTAVFYLSNILLPLVAAAGIYLVFAKNVWFVKVLSRFFAFSSLEWKTSNIQWIRNYLPDGLWAYALMMSVHWWLQEECKGLQIALTITLLFSSVMECLQKAGVLVGTFDFWDLLIQACGIFLAFGSILFWRRKNEKTHKNTGNCPEPDPVRSDGNGKWFLQ